MWEQAHKKKVLPAEWFIATPAENRLHAHGTAAIEVQLEARSSDKQAPAQTAPLNSKPSNTVRHRLAITRRADGAMPAGSDAPSPSSHAALQEAGLVSSSASEPQHRPASVSEALAADADTHAAFELLRTKRAADMQDTAASPNGVAFNSLMCTSM